MRISKEQKKKSIMNMLIETSKDNKNQDKYEEILYGKDNNEKKSLELILDDYVFDWNDKIQKTYYQSCLDSLMEAIKAYTLFHTGTSEYRKKMYVLFVRWLELIEIKYYMNEDIKYVYKELSAVFGYKPLKAKHIIPSR